MEPLSCCRCDTHCSITASTIHFNERDPGGVLRRQPLAGARRCSHPQVRGRHVPTPALATTPTPTSRGDGSNWVRPGPIPASRENVLRSLDRALEDGVRLAVADHQVEMDKREPDLGTVADLANG